MNKAKMNQTIEKYCNDFENNWAEEEYKWKDIKRFQDNYSTVCTSDLFVEMLQKSFDFSSNLVTSKNYFPASEILNLAISQPSKVQEAINSLLDEEKELTFCIERYRESILSLKKEFSLSSSADGADLRFISTLLFFCYPEKYTIYKYNEILQFRKL